MVNAFSENRVPQIPKTGCLTKNFSAKRQNWFLVTIVWKILKTKRNLENFLAKTQSTYFENLVWQPCSRKALRINGFKAPYFSRLKETQTLLSRSIVCWNLKTVWPTKKSSGSLQSLLPEEMVFPFFKTCRHLLKKRWILGFPKYGKSLFRKTPFFVFSGKNKSSFERTFFQLVQKSQISFQNNAFLIFLRNYKSHFR